MKKILMLILGLLIAGMPLTVSAAGMEFSNNSVKEGNKLDENDFPGMIITYTTDGIMVVDDPGADSNRLLRNTEAQVISPYGFMYSEPTLAEESLLFSIPRGKIVTILDSSADDDVAQISYAGYIGYIRKSNLKIV